MVLRFGNPKKNPEFACFPLHSLFKSFLPHFTPGETVSCKETFWILFLNSPHRLGISNKGFSKAKNNNLPGEEPGQGSIDRM